MLRIKHSVKMDGIKPQIALAASIAASVYDQFGCDCVITSITDGKHMKKSLHYQGEAMDLRTRNVPKDQHIPLVNTLKGALGSEYDVVYEKDHIHVEYDPK